MTEPPTLSAAEAGATPPSPDAAPAADGSDPGNVSGQVYGYPPARPPLRRSRHDRVVAGVCGGIGRSFGVDPVIPRIVLAVLALFGGTGLLLYGLAWLLIAEDDAAVSIGEGFAQRNGKGVTIVVAVLAGIVLLPLAMSSLAFLGRWGPWGPGYGPLLVIGVIALIAWLALRDRRRPGTTSAAPVANHVAAASHPHAGEAPPHPHDSYLAYPEPSTPSTWATRPMGYGPPSPPPAPPPQPLPPPAQARSRERSQLGVLTLSVAALTVGVLAVLDVAGVIEPDWVVYPASVLAVLALGLLVGSVIGRARWLVALAIPLVFVTVVAGQVNNLGNGEVGHRNWQPTTVAEASGPWELGVGDARLDLTGIQGLDHLTSDLPVRADIGVGELRVLVPNDVPVTVNAEAGFGRINVLSVTPGISDSGAAVPVPAKPRIPPEGPLPGEVYVAPGPEGSAVVPVPPKPGIPPEAPLSGGGYITPEVSDSGADVAVHRTFGDPSKPGIVLDLAVGAGHLEVVREAA